MGKVVFIASISLLALVWLVPWQYIISYGGNPAMVNSADRVDMKSTSPVNKSSDSSGAGLKENITWGIAIFNSVLIIAEKLRKLIKKKSSDSGD